MMLRSLVKSRERNSFPATNILYQWTSIYTLNNKLK